MRMMNTEPPSKQKAPKEAYLPVRNAQLFTRAFGQGQPIVVLHGGPDFDLSYLLPEMDHILDGFRRIYYDQRGRGKSAANVELEDVTIESEVSDLEAVRQYFQLESMTLLGHSWGVVLALEYALLQPRRVSRLILLNSAPVSHADSRLLRQERLRNTPNDIAELKARRLTDDFRRGDPDAVAEYYRVHFRATVKPLQHLENIVGRLRASFTQESILKARAIEKHLMDETWASETYDLIPRLQTLEIPTIVIHGDYDFVPLECATHIAEAIPGARFLLLENCGHFSYIECPDQVRAAIDAFFSS